MSSVKDFSYAFSKHRDITGGTWKPNDNPKAASFVGTGMSKWITTSVTSLTNTFSSAVEMNSDLSKWTVGTVTTLGSTFKGASKFVGTGLKLWDVSTVTSLAFTFYLAVEMNADLSGWQVGKVVTLEQTFRDASKFVGTDLTSWITASVTSLSATFRDAREMNSDLSKWNVAKVDTLYQTFLYATKFQGTGLESWDTSSVITLQFTFHGATEMNSDLSRWTVATVASLEGTFSGASKFVGTGLASWITTSVTNLDSTFKGASEMNADLSGWNVANVKTLGHTFYGASKFKGTGLNLWDIAKVISGQMSNTFTSTPSLTSCNKRNIADAWAVAGEPGRSTFADGLYPAAWSADTCAAPLTDDTFKQASWGTFYN